MAELSIVPLTAADQAALVDAIRAFTDETTEVGDALLCLRRGVEADDRKLAFAALRLLERHVSESSSKLFRTAKAAGLEVEEEVPF